VNDCYNHRVQVFDRHNGSFKYVIGSEGSEQGQLKNPRRVALTSQGLIVVADSGNNRIQVFSNEGEFVCSFGEKGAGEGQFEILRGITVDHQDNIIAADWNNCTVQIFSPVY